MIEIDWLNKLLEQNSQREITKQLWRYNDKVIATNGIAMIVINSDLVDCTSINPLTDISVVSEILDYEYRSVLSFNTKVDLQDFKEWLGEPETKYVGIFDVVVNGNILAQYLQELHDNNVTISCNGDKPVRFSGIGWDVYISPVRDVWQEVRKYERGRE